MKLVSIVTVIGFVVVALVSRTLACSYADGALFPSTYDDIKKADAIVLAEPLSRHDATVEFTVLEVLKGDYAESFAKGFEMNTSCTSISFPFQTESKLPIEIAKRIPRGTPKYLLFFNRTDGKWQQMSRATERFNYPILNTDSSSSLAAVKQLIRVALINDYESEKRELKKLQKLSKNGKIPAFFSEKLSKMIEHHLSNPTPDKSFKDLVEIYERSDKEIKRDVLWALVKGRKAETESFILNLLNSPIPTNYIGPISLFISETKNEPLLVRLGRNYPSLDKSSRWPLMWAMIKTANESHVELMMSALKSADQEEASRLIEWFVLHPNSEATDIARSLVDKKYEENWQLTFGLASMGDSDTFLWANDFVRTASKDRWKALHVVALSPLDEADKLARLLIQESSAKDLVSLIQGYKESYNPHRFDRLREIVNLKSRDSDVIYWLKETLESMESESDGRASELLKMIEK